MDMYIYIHGIRNIHALHLHVKGFRVSEGVSLSDQEKKEEQSDR
jgi:hypothetical protein